MQTQLFNDLLEATSRCFLDRNYDLWRRHVLLPFTLITRSGAIVMATEKELRENFDLYVKARETLHLDEVVRRPVSLEDCRDGTWIGTYETNLLRRGTRVTDPYTSSALLVEDDGVFRMRSVMNARAPQDWAAKRPHDNGE